MKKDEFEAYKSWQNMETDKKLEENSKIIKNLISLKGNKNMDAEFIISEMQAKIKKLEGVPV